MIAKAYNRYEEHRNLIGAIQVLNLKMTNDLPEILLILFNGNMLPLALSPKESRIISPEKDRGSYWRLW